MQNDFITTKLKIHLENGDYIYTKFNISVSFLIKENIQEIVDKYYKSKPYYNFNETPYQITQVDVL